MNQWLWLFQVHVPEGLGAFLNKGEFQKDKKKFKRETEEGRKKAGEGGKEKKKVQMLFIFPETEFRYSEWHQI